MEMFLACHNSHGEHGGLYHCCTDHTPVYGLSLGSWSHYCGIGLCVPVGCCSDAPYTYAGHKGDDGQPAMAGYCFLGSYIYVPFANLPDLWMKQFLNHKSWANAGRWYRV